MYIHFCLCFNFLKFLPFIKCFLHRFGYQLDQQTPNVSEENGIFILGLANGCVTYRKIFSYRNMTQLLNMKN